MKKKQQEKQDSLLDSLEDYLRVEDLNEEVRSVIEEDRRELRKKEMEDVETRSKKTLWTKVKDEIIHYYSGFKLFCLEVRISSKITWKLLRGKELTRRENRQLIRTVSDLFRILPFSVFVIVPFLELALPLVLKFFPQLLPSTFAKKSEKESTMRRGLKAKIQYAKFLQKTLDEMAPSDKSTRTSNTARDFVEFYKTVRERGITVVNKDILKFSPLFEDEITLDNMTRSQLVAICKMLEFNPIGTTNFLRWAVCSC